MPFKENEFSWFSKGIVYIVLLLAFISALVNIYQGIVVEPGSFALVILGFILFFASKLTVISKTRWHSFGPESMSNSAANLYRIGYWFMIAGILFTFAGHV